MDAKHSSYFSPVGTYLTKELRIGIEDDLLRKRKTLRKTGKLKTD